MDVLSPAPRFARTLYANGVLFAMLGILLALVGLVVGLAGDFWWLLWAGLAVSAVGILLWLIGSVAIAPIFGVLFTMLGVVVGLVGLLIGMTSDFWWLLWIGIGLFLTGALTTFCVRFFVSA